MSAGVAVGVLLGVVAIVGDLPGILLAVPTALAGASVTVFGLMFLFGVLNSSRFTASDVTAKLDAQWPHPILASPAPLRPALAAPSRQLGEQVP